MLCTDVAEARLQILPQVNFGFISRGEAGMPAFRGHRPVAAIHKNQQGQAQTGSRCHQTDVLVFVNFCAVERFDLPVSEQRDGQGGAAQIVDQPHLLPAKALLQLFLRNHPGQIRGAGYAVDHRSGNPEAGFFDLGRIALAHLVNNGCETASIPAGKFGGRQGLGTGFARDKQTENGFGAANITG